MKPEIVTADYCNGCPHFNPEATSLYAEGKAVETVVQCVYRDQCDYAVKNWYGQRTVNSEWHG